MTNIIHLSDDKETLLVRINRTLQLIHIFEKGIQLSYSLGAPKSLIEQDEALKMGLIKELLALLAQMNVNLVLKVA
jgi:hypothetical protein